MMAEEAGKAIGLSEVILIPAGQPMSKARGRIASAGNRLQMLRLAVAGWPHLKVSTTEIKRHGPSYTVDTLAELRRQYGRDDEIYFILGWDSLTQLPEWKEPGRIINMCVLVAIPRPGWPQPSLESLEGVIPGISQRVVFLEKPRVDISATAIRELAARGEPIDHLVTAAVAAYIKKHKLYTGKQEV
jgi:nicotinate-nucleotide adenylyltransferase